MPVKIRRKIMKKKGIALIATLAMSVAAFAAGCGGDPNGPDHPDGPTGPKEDVYQDYDPNKQPGGGSFDYEGNYSAPELTIDGKGVSRRKSAFLPVRRKRYNAAYLWRNQRRRGYPRRQHRILHRYEGGRRQKSAERRFPNQPRHSRQNAYHAGVGF